MMLGFIRWLGRRNRRRPTHYVPFTTVYDEIVDGADLPRLLEDVSYSDKAADAAAQHFLSHEAPAERPAILAAGRVLTVRLRTELGDDERPDTAVSLLIDQSGSMRGRPIAETVAAVECTCDVLLQTEIALEVLGFTTATWKGGRSRDACKAAGRPANPGRLCDLRHIVYRAATSTERVAPPTLRHAVWSGLLRENIDGEALAWAASRLPADRWKKRLFIVISDGAPVDDSTLAVNYNEILADHLAAIIADLSAQAGTKVAFLTLADPKMRRWFWKAGAAPRQDIGLRLMKLLETGLLGAPADS